MISRIAVFADVHGNLEALAAVLADMAALDVSHRICLGDIVGYGPNPTACLKVIRNLGCPILQGNHDWAVSNRESLENWSEGAKAGIELSRLRLSSEERHFLGELPLVMRQRGCQFVHASLHHPAEWHYIFTEEEALQHFAAQKTRISFCGHTHIPLVVEHRDDKPFSVRGAESGTITLHDARKSLVNAGSVGQPRDGCPDACYVIYHPREHAIQFRRVPYDVRKTSKKILRSRLPPFLADRLLAGT